ncbi:glutaredoxin [Actinotalea sp.]|uniref:glutaredoxin n=1 Tax=Actinotalea sp. TaxID=1872145 RepID=UPI0035634C09
MSTTAARQVATKVTVVTAPACHFCEDAQVALGDLAARYALDISVVDLESIEGRTLVALHRPAMNPLVLVDGAFFSAGRLPVKKLTARLRSTGRELPDPIRAEG